MGNPIKKSEVIKMFPRRDPFSHKGQNGRLLIIGGSIDYFGAPVLAGLGALNSGCDLVYLLVPECNFEVSRSFYPDLIVRKYVGNYVNTRTIDAATGLLPKVDCLLIGPGVSEDPESARVIARIIQKSNCPVVLDAEAIPAIAHLGLLSPELKPVNLPSITITPNRAEMDEITQGILPEDPVEEERITEDFAKKWGVTILLKKPHAIIASPDYETRENHTGNAGMTVGGSGDVLSGFVSSLIARRTIPYDACICASFLLGTTGDALYKQKGYNFTATDLTLELPYTIHGTVD